MRYPGGKGSCFRHIVTLMPAHHTYIETHLGGGNVLERKRPASTNIAIDVDRSLIDKWRDTGSRRLGFHVNFYCMDAVEFLRSYNFKGGELVYCDPPYLASTRRRQNLYCYEYTEAQHVELLETLVTLPCFVIVSGYQSSLYETVLQHRHGWRVIEFANTTRRGRVMERAWFNFGDVDHRHDCRYIGKNFRDRERIKRKRDRWRKKFERMSREERAVVLGALLELEPSKLTMEAPPAASLVSAMGSAPAPLAGNGEPRAPSDLTMTAIA